MFDMQTQGLKFKSPEEEESQEAHGRQLTSPTHQQRDSVSDKVEDEDQHLMFSPDSTHAPWHVFACVDTQTHTSNVFLLKVDSNQSVLQ